MSYRKYLQAKLTPKSFGDWWYFCALLGISIPTILAAAEGQFTALWVLVIIFAYKKGLHIYERRIKRWE